MSKDSYIDIDKAYGSLCTSYAKNKMKDEVKLLFECIDLEDWEEAGKITHSLLFLFINNESVRILKQANDNGLFQTDNDIEENKGYG